MLTSICVTSFNRTDHLIKTMQGIAQYCRAPYEVIVVDDHSTNPEVVAILERFKAEFEKVGVRFVLHVQERNGGAAAANNKAWSLSQGRYIFHVEDDIVVPHVGWNLAMALFMEQHGEVGQVAPDGSGRGEWIPRDSSTGPYREFAWALGGFFGIRREVYEKVGGWDEHLVHQIEPDYNLQVRMAGWRLAEVPGIRMVHLGEGEHEETFRRQAQIIVGVHQMLGKWNTRFMGNWDYDNVWSMSWDDFPPNAAFRRQLAAWFAAEAEKLADRFKGLRELKDDPKYSGAVPENIRRAYEDFRRCEMNGSPEPFKYPSHWGAFELVKSIRPCGRERERELITLMKNNYVFGNVRRVETHIRDLAARMNHTLAEGELESICAKVPLEYKWRGIPAYRSEGK